jgi:hypothetical protein
MQQDLLPHQTVAATFDTVAAADEAIRRLRLAGFTEDELTVVCPGQFKGECLCATPDAETAGAGAAEVIAKGGAAGAALGGMALAAAVLTGGVTAPAAALLIGGSAIAGGFSNLIVTKGYEVEPNDYVKQAVHAGRIVVGVDVHGEDPERRLARAERILADAGGGRPGRV